MNIYYCMHMQLIDLIRMQKLITGVIQTFTYQSVSQWYRNHSGFSHYTFIVLIIILIF